MEQGEQPPQGVRECPSCKQTWYSAALLNDDDAACPDCGATLEPVDRD